MNMKPTSSPQINDLQRFRAKNKYPKNKFLLFINSYISSSSVGSSNSIFIYYTEISDMPLLKLALIYH